MTTALIVEIRAAEGGDDAKDLVREQAGVYGRFCEVRGWACEIVSERPSQITLEIDGVGAPSVFAHETGGHRWQRVPPTEKRGRRHTSTVTVAALPVPSSPDAVVLDRDVEWSAVRGKGKGGQARNKTSNCVVAKHVPSGETVRVESSRSQWQNRQTALRVLAARLVEGARSTREADRSESRRLQVGSGQRGDKIRTIRMQDARVIDHRTGKRMHLGRYLAGHIDEVSQ